MNHEVRGILRYGGAPSVFPNTKPYLSEKELVLNCFDSQFEPSLDKDSKCLPVTALRTHPSIAQTYATLVEQEPDETHEVAFEHSRGSKHYGHFTRVRTNIYDTEVPSRASHREGEFTQFVLPSNGVSHNHTLYLDITHGNNVQIIWNHQSRTSHPIHIHGYKFVVAATHEADVFERCSIVDCPDEKDWFSWPLQKHIIDETVRENFIVKDTVVLPAGGYLVTRLIANNPGEWLAHSHLNFHLTDGMGLILREKSLSEEYIGVEKSQPHGFPECSGFEYESFDLGAISSRQPTCKCLPDPDTILNAAPETGWRCSKEHLCRHAVVIKETAVKATDNIQDQKNNENVRGIRQDTNWKLLVFTTSFSIICGLVLLTLTIRVDPCNEVHENDSPITNLFRLVFYDEWQKKMTIVGFVQVLGLSCVSGTIYFRSGFDVGERIFREKIAFIFWMCAFWSIGAIYSSIVTYFSDSWTTHNGTMLYKKTQGKENKNGEKNIDAQDLRSSYRTLEVISVGAPRPMFRSESFVTLERLRGRNSVQIQEETLSFSISSYHIARCFIGLILSSPSAFLFAMVTDSLTQMAPSASAVVFSGIILLLTQQSFDALGHLLAEISGRKAVGRAVCFGTIVSQALVIAGGFYRTVHPALSA
eukprot:CAMPEP_0178974112 /NCGR_PEP_ID=MMETSP0789-20121207/22226_1 /TAXON_ID=3005 /ORGANISM="Rhizosolenia setigera, Strain CCMP 1694" /LENGTH=644 /DNA_ID=CAMNT_0020662311 /DNA_START=32 /DNA_END=1963 /DNA_ORIENTATION=+